MNESFSLLVVANLQRKTLQQTRVMRHSLSERDAAAYQKDAPQQASENAGHRLIEGAGGHPLPEHSHRPCGSSYTGS